MKLELHEVSSISNTDMSLNAAEANEVITVSSSSGKEYSAPATLSDVATDDFLALVSVSRFD